MVKIDANEAAAHYDHHNVKFELQKNPSLKEKKNRHVQGNLYLSFAVMTDQEALEDIMEAFKVVYTYDAISLEGQNRIPYEDVKTLIQRKTLLEYSEREQKEVLNHVLAFEKILSMVKHKEAMTEDKLKDLHEMVVDGIFQGGVYRNVNIQMMGSTHQPTDLSLIHI